jgi:hypothetical protein
MVSTRYAIGLAVISAASATIGSAFSPQITEAFKNIGRERLADTTLFFGLSGHMDYKKPALEKAMGITLVKAERSIRVFDQLANNGDALHSQDCGKLRSDYTLARLMAVAQYALSDNSADSQRTFIQTKESLERYSGALYKVCKP